MKETRMEVPVRYKTVRGWSGTRYRVRMTDEEIRAIEGVKLLTGILIGVPGLVVLMAVAAGLI